MNAYGGYSDPYGGYSDPAGTYSDPATVAAYAMGVSDLYRMLGMSPC